jgi:hypothetical protein
MDRIEHKRPKPIRAKPDNPWRPERKRRRTAWLLLQAWIRKQARRELQEREWAPVSELRARADVELPQDEAFVRTLRDEYPLATVDSYLRMAFNDAARSICSDGKRIRAFVMFQDKIGTLPALQRHLAARRADGWSEQN